MSDQKLADIGDLAHPELAGVTVVEESGGDISRSDVILKGALAAGSDADICVLDTGDKRVIRAGDLHEADYTPWEGRRMEAWPCLTVLRGKVVVENGEWRGSLADGKWQPRKVAADILDGPML